MDIDQPDLMDIDDPLRRVSFQDLPNEVLGMVMSYLGQSQKHRVYRVNRKMYDKLGPEVWRKVILAPDPRWVEHAGRSVERYPDGGQWQPVGFPGAITDGFHRTSRLLHHFMYPKKNQPRPHFYFAQCCIELVICEVMFDAQLNRVYEIFSSTSRTKIFSGAYLIYNQNEVGGPETAFRIEYDEEIRKGYEGNEGIPKPHFLFESVQMGLDFIHEDLWYTHRITELHIDVESHLTVSPRRRKSFFKNFFFLYRHNNHDISSWLSRFPNIEKLTVGSWWLEALWRNTHYLNYGPNGPNDEYRERINDFGIGGIPQHDYW